MRILGMKLGDERCLNTGLPDPFELMRHSIGATNNHSQNSIRPCSNRAFRAYDDFFHHWQRYTSPFLCYTRNHIRRNWFTKILDWLSRHAHQTNFLLYYQRNHIPRISIAIYENISPEISSLYAWHLRRRTLQTLCVNVKKNTSWTQGTLWLRNSSLSFFVVTSPGWHSLFAQCNLPNPTHFS